MGRKADIRDRRSIASYLDLSSSHPSIEEVVDAVRAEVEDAVRESRYPEIESVDQLERVICDVWGIQIETIESDSDFDEITDRRSYVRHSLPSKLTRCFQKNGQLGAVFENESHEERGLRWLAVVDARGRRASAAEFTKWHEIAHVLTGYFPDDGEADGDKAATATVDKSEPDRLGERIVDRVASELLYWRPIWEPKFAAHFGNLGGLTFDLIDEFRREYAPAASFYSCAIRCVENFHRPCILTKVDMGWKASVRREWHRKKQNRSLSIVDPPSPPDKQLRLVEFITPDDPEFEDPMKIRWNFRVPETSVLRGVYEADRPAGRSEHTDQSEWESKSRGRFPRLPLYIEAKQFGPNTLGLIQPDWNVIDFEEHESGDEMLPSMRK